MRAMGRMPAIAEIAQQSHVSTYTASLALRNSAHAYVPDPP